MIYTLRYNGTVIASSFGDMNQMIYGGRIEMRANEAGALEFMFPADHVSYRIPRPLGGIVSVERDGKEIFFGRVLSISTDERLCRTYRCEGALAFMHDVTTESASSAYMTLEELMAYFSAHSGYTFTAGPAPLAMISITGKTVMDCLANFAKKNGGYFYTYRESGTMKLGYTAGALKEARQEIRLRKNLTAISVEEDATDTVTRILASAGALSATFEKNTDLYGEIEVTREYAATTGTELATMANADLNREAYPMQTIEVEAIDMSEIDTSQVPIEMLDNVRVVSEPHLVDDFITATAITIDMSGNSPAKITLGTKKKTLTQIVG